MNNNELERLERAVVLPGIFDVHRESARFLLDDEPGRKHMLHYLAAYVAVHHALRHVGRAHKIQRISCETPTKDLQTVTGYIRDILDATRIAYGRYTIAADKLTIKPNVCKHCDAADTDHVDGKCLFHSTSFEPLYTHQPGEGL